MTCGIYVIRRHGTEQCYVGSSQDIKERWYRHRRNLRRGKHPSAYLQNAWNKYGEESFAFEIMEVCSKETLIEREQYFIDTLKPAFNMALYAGAPMRGRKQSDAQKAAVRARMNGNTYRVGWKHSPERKAEIARVFSRLPHAVGWRHSDEAKARISAAMKGKRHALGHVQTADAIQRRVSAIKETCARRNATRKFPLASGSV